MIFPEISITFKNGTLSKWIKIVEKYKVNQIFIKKKVGNSKEKICITFNDVLIL